MNIFKTLAVTTPLAVSALVLTGCNSSENNKAVDEQPISENYSPMPIEKEYNAKSNEKIDINKPNLPRRIDSNIIQYRNLSGKPVNVKIVDNATISLYSAIQKHSTSDSLK